MPAKARAAGGDPPRLPHGEFATHEGQWLQVAGPAPCEIPSETQEFSAPGGSVRAPSGAVEADGQHRLLRARKPPVLGEHGRGMGQVVLDQKKLPVPPTREFLGEPPAGVVGVGVGRDQPGLDLEEIFEPFDDLAQKGARRFRVQVAHVLAWERLAVDSNAGGHLEVAAHGQQWHRCRLRQGQWLRDPTPSSAQHDGPAGGRADHRVVHPANHIAIVEEKTVGDFRKALDGLTIGTADRLLREVGRGHHQGRHGRIGQKLHVQGRGGDHDTQIPDPRGDVLADGGWLPSGCEHDRRPRGGHDGAVSLIEIHQTIDLGKIADHHRERLGGPPFSFSEGVNRVGKIGAAGQLKPSEALDGKDGAVEQGAPCSVDGFLALGDPLARLS